MMYRAFALLLRRVGEGEVSPSYGDGGVMSAI